MAESSGTSATELIKENCTAIDGLRHSQTVTALNLQSSFLAAKDRPDIAKNIRLVAHSAQTQHSLSLDCMVKFSASSKHVVGTFLPMIVEGIDDKMPELITGAFKKIQTIAEQMYSDAKQTVQRYQVIQGQVQLMMSDIGIKHAEVDLKPEKTIYTKEYDRLCKEKEHMMQELSKTSENERVNDRSSDIFTNMLFPVMAISGVVALGIVGTPAALFTAPFAKAGLTAVGIGIGNNYVNEIRKTIGKGFHRNDVTAQKDEIEGKIQSRVEQIRAEEKLKELKGASTSTCLDSTADATGLINVSVGLGQVYDQLVSLQEFWGRMVVAISLINEDTGATEVYKARYDKLRGKVKQSEMNWKIFIAVCDKYVNVCREDDTESIRKLYAFLSEPINSMTKAGREERQANIAEQLRKMKKEFGSA